MINYRSMEDYKQGKVNTNERGSILIHVPDKSLFKSAAKYFNLKEEDLNKYKYPIIEINNRSEDKSLACIYSVCNMSICNIDDLNDNGKIVDIVLYVNNEYINGLQNSILELIEDESDCMKELVDNVNKIISKYNVLKYRVVSTYILDDGTNIKYLILFQKNK